MTRVEQCPRCELRFRDEHELRSHLETDHDQEAARLTTLLERTEVDRHRRERRWRRAAARGVAPPPGAVPRTGDVRADDADVDEDVDDTDPTVFPRL